MNAVVSLLVELYSSPVYYVGSIAEHHWLLAIDGDSTDRWEVWQEPDVGGESWGHLHRNLLEGRQPVARGPARFQFRWTGEQAEQIAVRLAQSPSQYPWQQIYRYWPGPNSNTYIQWVLRPYHRLGWKALGKNYWRLMLCKR